MKSVILIAHNLRSTHNVGSLLRTAEGLGVAKVYLTGYTPYPLMDNDPRLPHISRKLNDQIHKTALDAEKLVDITVSDDINGVLMELKNNNYQLVALEQSDTAVSLQDFNSDEKIALIVGREVEGIENEILEAIDVIVEIPMKGKKESFNVVQAAAMALYILCK
jgi:23S rRNA (guanosine2251-2'-O)-methyltransferase